MLQVNSSDSDSPNYELIYLCKYGYSADPSVPPAWSHSTVDFLNKTSVAITAFFLFAPYLLLAIITLRHYCYDVRAYKGTTKPSEY
jgi:hypothetical protein